VAALAASPFIIAAPLESSPAEQHWSYNDVYRYAVKHGGTEHPVGELIAKFISTSMN
jgi:hypothetical protein